MNPATDPPPDKEQRYAPFRNLMRKRYARLVTVLGTSGLCKVFVSMAEHMQWIPPLQTDEAHSRSWIVHSERWSFYFQNMSKLSQMQTSAWGQIIFIYYSINNISLIIASIHESGATKVLDVELIKLNKDIKQKSGTLKQISISRKQMRMQKYPSTAIVLFRFLADMTLYFFFFKMQYDFESISPKNYLCKSRSHLLKFVAIK